MVLHRYNMVLDELFAGQDVYVITTDWSERPSPGPRAVNHDQWHPGAQHWMSVCTNDSVSGEEIYTHLYASRIRWQAGRVDTLLRAVADDQTANVMVTDVAMRYVHHPYDGGADVRFPDRCERDQMRDCHSDWLSAQPTGL